MGSYETEVIFNLPLSEVMAPCSDLKTFVSRSFFVSEGSSSKETSRLALSSFGDRSDCNLDRNTLGFMVSGSSRELTIETGVEGGNEVAGDGA